jgi:hypothetical protein
LENIQCICCDEKQAKKAIKCSKKVFTKEKLLVTRKIRSKPSEDQKKLFHRWFGITRFTYNEALRLINEEGWKPS